ncbi:MAG TPA: hypothetical protein VK614_15480 [Allosphingosinicella sp.]|nr:hypothetical protein [Allosphingosinicella sp.]
MEPTPLLVILDTLLGLFERRLQWKADASRADLLLIGKQLHRLNGLYIRLVESELEAATRDRVRE